MLIYIMTVMASFLSDANFMDKNAIDISAPPLTYAPNRVHLQLQVVPKILKIISEFALNKDLIQPEKAADYLRSIYTPPFKLIESRELIAQFRAQDMAYDITLVDEFTVSPLLREPNLIINKVVADYYKDLRFVLEDIAIKGSTGEQITSLINLSNKILNWITLKDHLKII